MLGQFIYCKTQNPEIFNRLEQRSFPTQQANTVIGLHVLRNVHFVICDWGAKKRSPQLILCSSQSDLSRRRIAESLTA